MSRPMGEHPYEPYRPRPGHSSPPGYPPPGAPPPVAPPPPAHPRHSDPRAPYRQEPTYLPPVPPPGPPAPPSRTHHRPRRFWYVIALVALLPGWIGFLVWRNASQGYGMDSYGVGTTVDRGATAEVAGATWRFVSIGPAPPPPAFGKRTPHGGALIRAYISVTPHTTAAAKRIVVCQIMVRDDRARVWSPADSEYVPYDASVPDSCVPRGSDADHIPAGHTQKIGVTFLVPADVARSVRPMVRPTSEDRYVLFR